MNISQSPQSLILFRTVAAFVLAVACPLAAAESLEAPESKQKESASKTRIRYEALLKAAQKNPPAPGSVICIGSSQMELWKTVGTDLAPLKIFNHGIGGSRMSHAAELYIPNLAIPFKPRAVILYEGSNDIAGGVEPEKILSQFKALHAELHRELPEARLYVLGIVPSPGKRFEKIDLVRSANALLQRECESHPWIKFIDTTTPLLGADGLPRLECFIADNIHMNAAGYEVWKAAIRPVVLPIEQPFEH